MVGAEFALERTLGLQRQPHRVANDEDLGALASGDGNESRHDFGLEQCRHHPHLHPLLAFDVSGSNQLPRTADIGQAGVRRRAVAQQRRS